MLDTHLIEHLITQYLQAGLNNLESKAFGRKYKTGEIETSLDYLDYVGGLFPLSPEKRATNIQQCLVSKQTSPADSIVKDCLAPLVLMKYGKKLEKAEARELALRLTHADKQLAEVEAAVVSGNFDALEALKDRIVKSRTYIDLKTLSEKYKEKYLVDNPDLTKRAAKHLDTELAVILQIFDNVSIDTVNSRDGIVFCKKILRSFPKNMTQRFNKRPRGWVEGDKPYTRTVHQIIAQERDYETIDPHTANSYIKRLKVLIDHAIKYAEYDKPNRWSGELFEVPDSEDRKRKAYDQEDISKLIDALCTKPLWRYADKKPERFWLILISLLQGFRLGSITELTKEDIMMRNGILGFQVRFGKTKNTKKFYPMNDCLVLLGFVDWVDSLNRNKLFQDTPDQASKWYNRVDRDKNGNTTSAGFEYVYVTQDRRKCLHSMRHSYGGKVFEITDDIKATADAMGHAMIAGRVTSRYIGEAGLKNRKALLDKLNFDLDLNQLEARAKELFDIS
jgi:integrase